MKAKDSNKRVKLALNLFTYRIKKYIGGFTSVMSGCDAVIFTGGIGENNPDLVKEICEGVISKGTKTLMIPTDEELMIARDTYRITK
jgi:acetate kinase